MFVLVVDCMHIFSFLFFFYLHGLGTDCTAFGRDYITMEPQTDTLKNGNTAKLFAINITKVSPNVFL